MCNIFIKTSQNFFNMEVIVHDIIFIALLNPRKNINFFSLPKFCQLQPFKLETPNLHQLLTLWLRKIALSPIFDICLGCPNLGNYCTFFGNFCQLLRNNGTNWPKSGKMGQISKIGLRAIFCNPKVSNWSKFGVSSLNSRAGGIFGRLKNYIF